MLSPKRAKSMQPINVFSTTELREKVHQLILLGLTTKEAIATCALEFNQASPFPSHYSYKEYQIEITSKKQNYGSPEESEKTLWESIIHLPSKTVVCVGAYLTQLEAALMAEKTINQWKY